MALVVCRRRNYYSRPKQPSCRWLQGDSSYLRKLGVRDLIDSFLEASHMSERDLPSWGSAFMVRDSSHWEKRAKLKSQNPISAD